tara:strand:+ start:120 stop:614 length:495 start_codon:yes stop_codon:yes gene_type:complete
MADFAQLDDNNVVINAIVVSDEDVIDKVAWWDPLKLFTGKRNSEEVGISFCHKLFGDDTNWKETRSTGWGRGTFRGNKASPGMTYMTDVKTLGVASTDIFINNQPFPSWSIGIQTALWVPPGPPGWEPKLTQFEKSHNMRYIWDEEKYKLNPNNAWVLISRSRL